MNSYVELSGEGRLPKIGELLLCGYSNVVYVAKVLEINYTTNRCKVEYISIARAASSMVHNFPRSDDLIRAVVKPFEFMSVLSDKSSYEYFHKYFTGLVECPEEYIPTQYKVAEELRSVIEDSDG